MRLRIISLMLVLSMLFSFVGVTYADTATPTTVTQEKHLHKSQTDKMVGGVCGGLAEYFGIDSTLVRASFIFGFMFGAGEVAYVILWFVMPNK